MKPLLQIDLDFVLSRLESELVARRGSSWLITGATGLFGKWLLEVLLAANKRLSTNFHIFALSRNPQRFCETMPHLCSVANLHWIQGDVIDFTFPTRPLDFIVHAAAEVQPSTTLSGKIVAHSFYAMNRMLELCRLHPSVKFLFTSSGAVYGAIPTHITHVSETYQGAPDVLSANAGYGEAKRICELMLASAHAEWSFDFKISRTFAVVGPHLPLDAHFAIGNFIGQTLQNSPIFIDGDGTPTRSYIHMAEQTLWLLKILFSSTPNRVYNVGSHDSRSILEVAQMVARHNPKSTIQVAKKPSDLQSISRYVPNIERIQQDLGLQIEIPLGMAIQRTMDWWAS